ncbi:hypothetical protein M378DRAFT_163850 [Amanita muscaria Koide BX008]|uniref:Uncharacterized protein n=1 Tax=Amanita muscaria (strain Koide BX008) TaxID=946122 RepID=A0A0C2TAZ8_AMAMK|nr:hypothetical protein M378DRAFT_163850 [Amanita muscaria Koide BX008]
MAASRLPPTTNSLDASQRARLLKSTRKLTAVLGATPHVVDTDLVLLQPATAPSTTQNTPARRKRQGILYTSPNAASTSFISLLETDDSGCHYNTLHRQASERSSDRKQRCRRKSALDRPLVLRLHPPNSLSDSIAQHSASYNIRLSVASVASPLTPLFSTASPTIALDGTDPDDVESKLRRKRMVKLTRTLGENIPSELLLSQCSRGRSSDEQGRNVRQKISTDTSRPSAKKDRRRSNSLIAPTHPFPIRTTSLARSASATVPKAQRHQSHHHRRAESEWNGEWNIEDAEKRAKALRNLRCR